MKAGAFSHPKVEDLADELGIPHAHAVGHYALLKELTLDAADDGGIGKWSDHRIEKRLGWLEAGGEPGGLIAAMIKVRMLDEHPECRLYVHDWHEHAEDYIHKRLAGKVDDPSTRRFFANGARPRLTKFSLDDRARISAEYDRIEAQRTNETTVRSQCAPSALPERTNESFESPPSQAKPSPSKPCRAGGSAREAHSEPPPAAPPDPPPGTRPRPRTRPADPPRFVRDEPAGEPCAPRHLGLADRMRGPQVRLRPKDRHLTEPLWPDTRARWAEAFQRLDAEFGSEVVDGAMSRYDARDYWRRKVTEPAHWRRGGMIREAHAEYVARHTESGEQLPDRATCRYREEVDFRASIGELTEHQASREHDLLERAGVRRSDEGQAYADELRALWERDQQRDGPPPERPPPRARPRPRLVAEGRDRPAKRDVEERERQSEVDVAARKRVLEAQAAALRGEA